jgi:acyl-CoA thioester hydrolase
MSTIGETTFRVRYSETDQMRVAYHPNYIIWFELGRVAFLRELGFTYSEMEEDGMHLPLVEVRCRYKHPARFDDEITIRTRLAQMRTSLLRFRFEVVRNSDGRLLAEGESVHMVVGNDLRPTRLSEKYRATFEAAAARVEGNPAQV